MASICSAHWLLILDLSFVIGFHSGLLIEAGMLGAGRPSAMRPTLSNNELGEVRPSGSLTPETKGEREWMVTFGSPIS
jgi:hypothetical protein